MKGRLSAVVAVMVMAVFNVACGNTPPPVVTPDPTVSVSVEPTLSAAPTPPTPSPSATPSAAPTPTSAPTATPFVADRIYTSDDGQLTMLVPEDAIPDDVALSAQARGQGDLPLELFGLEVRSAFYEIGPDGLDFDPQVRMERQLRLRDIDVDLAEDGLPVLVMAMRSSGAAWDWLGSQTLALADRSLVATGDASNAGLLFAFGGRTFTTLDWSEPTRVVPVGSTITLTVAVTYPEESTDPPVLGELSPVVASGEVQALATTPSDGVTASVTFRCDTAGEVSVGATYPITNVDAKSVLFGVLGLGPASTIATVTQTITCTDEPVATPTAGPSGSPAPSLPSL